MPENKDGLREILEEAMCWRCNYYILTQGKLSCYPEGCTDYKKALSQIRQWAIGKVSIRNKNIPDMGIQATIHWNQGYDDCGNVTIKNLQEGD